MLHAQVEQESWYLKTLFHTFKRSEQMIIQPGVTLRVTICWHRTPSLRRAMSARIWRGAWKQNPIGAAIRVGLLAREEDTEEGREGSVSRFSTLSQPKPGEYYPQTAFSPCKLII